MESYHFDNLPGLSSFSLNHKCECLSYTLEVNNKRKT